MFNGLDKFEYLPHHDHQHNRNAYAQAVFKWLIMKAIYADPDGFTDDNHYHGHRYELFYHWKSGGRIKDRQNDGNVEGIIKHADVIGHILGKTWQHVGHINQPADEPVDRK
jgi:hypothetical protein